MTFSDNFKAGIFIAGAVVLCCTMLFFFGMSDIFVRKARMQTYFKESVQGLSSGSPVKYKGVSIGSVSDISIMVGTSTICVGIEIDLKSFRTHEGEEPFDDLEDFKAYVNKAVNEGLRCRLELAGITGMRYLEIDYYEAPGKVITPKEARQSDVVYIPSVPSAFKDIAKSINNSLERISKIKFEEISDNMYRSINDIQTYLNSKELKTALDNLSVISGNLRETSGTVNKVITEKRLEELSGELSNALRKLSALAEKISHDSEEAKVGESAQAFREAAAAVRSAAEMVNDQRYQTAQLFDKLNQTLDAMRELIDNIKADPSSVVSGRRSPEER